MIERLAKHLGHVNQYSWETRLKGEINKVKQRLMKDTELGRQVAQLESEKEYSLDAVWLATSNKQIRELWTQVAAECRWSGIRIIVVEFCYWNQSARGDLTTIVLNCKFA